MRLAPDTHVTFAPRPVSEHSRRALRLYVRRARQRRNLARELDNTEILRYNEIIR